MEKKFENEYPMFDFLYDYGFTASPCQHLEGFGNWNVYLISDKFVIQILQDRGDMFFSLAAPGKKTNDVHSLSYIALSAYIGFIRNDIKYSIPIRDYQSIEDQLIRISNIIREYYDELCAFFETSDFSDRMKKFEHFLNQRREYTISRINKDQ